MASLVVLSSSHPTHLLCIADPWVDDICPTPPHAPQLMKLMMLPPPPPPHDEGHTIWVGPGRV